MRIMERAKCKPHLPQVQLLTFIAPLFVFTGTVLADADAEREALGLDSQTSPRL